MPLLLLPIAGLLGYSWATRATTNDILQTAQEKNSGLNLTTVATYAIVAGVVVYFGKRIIK